jgi:DNA-binding NarL/FixJ family response regulator
MIKVLVADDSAEVRAALNRIIEKTPDITVAGEAASGQEAISRIEEQEFSIVLLDISLPDFNGLEVLKRTRNRRPDLRVLMVSVHSEQQYAVPAFRAGACGYLTKDRAHEQLVMAIRKISTGGLFFSPAIAEQLGIDLGDDPPAAHKTETIRRANS